MSTFNGEQYTKAVTSRFATIRLRTWTLTLAIVVALVFYFLVTLTTKQEINPVDFCLLCVVQMVIHSIYFPDGELYGQKDSAYIANKTSYNSKATSINQQKKIGRVRKYCKIEFEERKERYILNECGVIGITIDELQILKQVDEQEIKKLKSYEFKYDNDQSKLVFFSKFQRKRLYNLIFKKLPIEENHPETIMSAVENNGNNAIKDGSISYKRNSYIRKILMAVVIGGTFAYIGYTLRDGIGLAEITSIIMYLTALFTTAVMAFTSGETCSKVHKSRFYVELINFIDGFLEWDSQQPQAIEEKLVEYAIPEVIPDTV